TADIRNGNIAEAPHQHAVDGNFEMGFEFPPPSELRNDAIQDERVEKVDVIGDENTGALGIKAGGSDHFDARASKEHDSAAKRALQPIVLSWMKDESKDDKNWHGNSEVQQADCPEQSASKHVPGALHMNTSTAPGRMSMDLHSSVSISPSIRMSTATGKLNSTWRTARREASGCWVCVPS